MDEFAGGRDLRIVAERLAQPVLHGLHVVIGGRLDRLHALGIGQREPGGHAVQGRHGRCRECGQEGERRFRGERL